MGKKVLGLSEIFFKEILFIWISYWEKFGGETDKIEWKEIQDLKEILVTKKIYVMVKN